MKYAVLAMIVVYVIAFSMSPEKEEKATGSHAQEQHNVVEGVQKGNSAVHDVAHEQSVETQIAAEVVEVAEPKVEKNKVPANKWEAIAQSATQNVLALMNEDATLPQPEKKAEPVQAKVVETQKPCIRKVAQSGHDQPAATKPCPVVCPGFKAQEDSAASGPSLNTAMQKLADATNDMVAVTRQLVGATREMLIASKKVAVEVIDSGKEIMEDKEAQAAAQAKLVEAVQDVVDATKEAYEATSEALSDAIQAEAAKQ